MAANIEKFDFDPEKLRQKYREERDNRLRADGNENDGISKEVSITRSHY